MKSPCKKCGHYNNGEGEKVCLKCPKIERAANHNVGLKEALLSCLKGGDKMLANAATNYNDVLHDQMRTAEMVRRYKKMEPIKRAILALHIMKFKPAEISGVLQDQGQAVSVSRICKYIQRVNGNKKGLPDDSPEGDTD